MESHDKSAFVVGLEKFQHAKRQETLDRVQQAITKLQSEEKEINFKSVSDISGITRKTLYKVDELRTLIESLRQNRHPNGGASKAALQEQLDKIDLLEKENSALKRELLQYREQKERIKELRSFIALKLK
jgi:hypothetical protein